VERLQQHGRAAKRASNRRRFSWLPVLIVFVFPIGLMVMWSDRCKWSRWGKAVVSTGVAAALTMSVVLAFSPPERPRSGITLVGARVETEFLGPVAPDDLPEVEIYNPQPTAYLPVLQPTSTPIHVYYNEGGKFYHNRQCKYIKRTSHIVSLDAALGAGFKPCRDCKAPAEDQA